MTYYLVAGEASGDLHGANLMKSLKEQDPQAVFRYFGGDRMKNEGGVLVKHYADMAFMGFTEVILNLSTILKNLAFCKADILSFNPDVLILIDFPGFNLKIADFAKKKGLKVFYYISPKVWAWNQKRVLKIKQNVDKMFCILPFEVDFYREWGMEVDYVGNPLLDEKSHFKQNPDFLKNLGIKSQKIIALLPGSRKQEIERLLPNMVQVCNQFPDHHFMVAAAPSFNKDYYDQLIGGRSISIVFGQTYDLLAVADAALVASGTATLETALFKVPQVVVYKGGTISIAIARALVTIKFISLVNLIMNRQVVQELIQKDCNPEKITHYLKQITTGPERKIMLNDYEELAEKMGLPGASDKTAKLIVSYLKS
jgi:lipid-A-disaccharide synthase